MKALPFVIVASLGLGLTACSTAAIGPVPIRRVPRYQVCLGVRKSGLSSTRFLKSVESHLRFFNLPQAWPEQLDTVFVAIEDPAARLGKLSDQYALAVYRDESFRSDFKDEVFPPLSPQIFNPLRSHCEKAQPMASGAETLIKTGTLVDIFGDVVDWKKGTTRLLIGSRPSSVKANDFLWSLTRYIQSRAAAFRDLGLKGFLVYATENHVVLFMNWAESVKGVESDLKGLVEETLSSDAENFSGKIVPSHLYQMHQDTLINK